MIALLLFITEVCIALFMHDRFIRPFVGDVLVVMLMYYAIRSLLNLTVVSLAIGVLLFAFMVETLQYFHVVNRLGLQDNRLARIVIGTSFEWTDLLAYTIGFVLILFLQKNKY